MTNQTKFIAMILLVGLLLLATWLRFWQLDVIPPGLWFDESYNAMDAVWALNKDNLPIFLNGNHGREAMYHYLLAFFISMLGETPYAVRFVSAVLGILSLPLMYRWAFTLFRSRSDGMWVALVGTAGLTTSFWVLVMNRTGYRANLLPLFVLLISYFYWRGWKTTRFRFYLLAGVFLGLAQYTYFSARLLPLVFVIFLSVRTLFELKDNQAHLKRDWLGLVVMGGASFVVALPILLFSFNNPAAAWGRTIDVAVKVDGSSTGLILFVSHFLDALRVFVDGEDPNWRHHLLGQPVFGWLNLLGFWLGVIVAVRNYRYPAYQFILISLIVMWLPAPLSNPSLHTLRLAGMLPSFYALVGLGLVATMYAFQRRWLNGENWWQAGFAALILVVIFSGGYTVYRYFVRWPHLPEVRQAFDEPVVDIANYLTNSQTEVNIIIPFYLYTHATIRYLLHNDFSEEVLLPEEVRLWQAAQSTLLIPEYPPDDGKPPAYVWLMKKPGQPGVAYVSTVNREAKLDSAGLAPPIQTLYGYDNQEVAQLYSIGFENIQSIFPAKLPDKPISVEWADNLRLIGYEFSPAAIEAGQETNLFLSWELLGYTGLQEKMFLQLLDSAGNPVGQKEVDPISHKMYRWRDDGLILEQHPLIFGAELPAGLYFVRLGFFDPKTDERLPAYGLEHQPLGDEFIVGPLYVQSVDNNPITPQHSLQAIFGDNFELIGYSVYPVAENSTEIKLYWKTDASSNVDYTVFVQLLDEQNQIIAQVDAQPLPGIYPTSHWQPGDIISDKFVLPVSVDQITGHTLITGMYDLITGDRLPAYDTQGEVLPNGATQLEEYQQ